VTEAIAPAPKAAPAISGDSARRRELTEQCKIDPLPCREACDNREAIGCELLQTSTVANPSLRTNAKAQESDRRETPQVQADKLLQEAEALKRRGYKVVRRRDENALADAVRDAQAGIAKANRIGPNISRDWLLRDGPSWLAEAEQLISAAEQVASRLDAEREAETRGVEEESARMREAEATCGGATPTCEKACTSGNQLACVVLGRALYDANALTSAARSRGLFEKSCQAGLRTGCLSLRLFERKEGERSAKADSLWSDVADEIDRIAVLTARKRIAEQVGTSSQTRRAIPLMGAEIVRKTRDEYCPTKQAFVDFAGPAEFQQRARSKCTDDPPTTSGLHGAELTLTNECRGLVANPCASTPSASSTSGQRKK
jgi:hypothetical protein